MYKIINGKEIAFSIRSELSQKIACLNKEVGLAVVLVGENPASQVYVRNKIKACEEVGIKSSAYYLPEKTSQTELEKLLKELAEDSRIDGILVQLPLPKHLSEKALELIPFNKDVDGFSAENIGRLCLNGEKLGIDKIAYTKSAALILIHICWTYASFCSTYIGVSSKTFRKSI